MSDPAQTVTLTLGNVLRERLIAIAQRWPQPSAIVTSHAGDLTALVLYAIEELRKSAPLLPSPSEREELASVISHAINFDDGAHHLSMGDDGEPCRACQDVADAVLAKGYSKRSSPSSRDLDDAVKAVMACATEAQVRDQLSAFIPASPSSAGQEVREAVREALTKLAISDLTDEPFGANDEDILAWRDREYPALSAGEAETRT